MQIKTIKKPFIKQIPNLLTIIRLPLLVISLVLFSYQNSFSIFPLTAWFLSDMFDGWIARKLGAESTFGKYADHIVDGVSLLIAYTYILSQPINGFVKVMVLIIIVRILLIALKYYFLSKRGEQTKPSSLGKLSSGAQMLAIIAFFAVPSTFLFIFILAFILSILSGIDYFKN